MPITAVDPITALVVTEYARSAFTGTGPAERLRGAGVTQVVVVGIAETGTTDDIPRYLAARS
ncbi:MAG: hypothetical protein HOQ44_20735 [Nocardia sp.]|nr:hypothetical protein [Nocardia sp.]